MATVSLRSPIDPGLYRNMPYDPVKDFRADRAVWGDACILGGASVTSSTGCEGLVALLKSEPGKYTFGSSGVGSILQLCGERFEAAAGGLNGLRVPYAAPRR